MPLDSHWLALLAALSLLAAPACALAWLLRIGGGGGGGKQSGRGTRGPGGAGGAHATAIVAGIFIGLLVGPSVLGKAMPQWHTPLFLGGTQQAKELTALQSRHASDRAALNAIDASPAAIDELQLRHTSELEPLSDALKTTRAERRELLDLILTACAALALACASIMAVPRSPATWKRLARALVETSAAPVRVGLGYAFAGVTVPSLIGLLFLSPRQSIAIALTLTISGAALSLGPELFIACAIATTAIAAAALLLAWSPMFTLIIAGLILGLLAALSVNEHKLRPLRRAATTIVLAIALPALSAMLASRFDLLAAANAAPMLFWFSMITALIWCSDGRLLSFWSLLRLTGWSQARSRPWTTAARATSAGPGLAQLILLAAFVTALPTSAGPLIPEAIIPGVIAGAALAELTRGARAWVARMMETPHAAATR